MTVCLTGTILKSAPSPRRQPIQAFSHLNKARKDASERTLNRDGISSLVIWYDGARRFHTPRIRQVIPMHLLRLFLTAWLVLGTVTVSFLFWLCMRTATKDKDKDSAEFFSSQRAEIGTHIRAA